MWYSYLIDMTKNNLIPTFAWLKLAVKVMLEDIITNYRHWTKEYKHQKGTILLNKIKKRQEELKSSVGYVTYVVFYHKKVMNKN